MKIRWFAVLLMLFPLFAAAADSTAICNKPSFLKPGFNLNDYNLCKQHISSECPNKGMFPDETCVSKVLKENSVCKQLNMLAQTINMPPSAVNAKAVANFTLIDAAFTADGQHQYYIISRDGCLVNTLVDPRNLDKALAKRYQKNSFVIVTWKEPTYQRLANGEQIFTAIFKVTDGCIACSIVGWAKVEFHFSKNDALTKTVLVSFKPGTAP